MFRLQNNIPSPYLEQSRDFQLIARMLDTIVSGLRHSALSVGRTIDTDSCPAEYLRLLSTKLGFFTTKEFLDRELREVLKAFPYLIRGKGTKTAIEEAVNLFLRAIQLKTESFVTVDNENYKVIVNIQSSVVDTSLLDELLRYLLPVGYTVEYVFYVRQKYKKEAVSVDNVKLLYNLGDMTNAQLRSVGFDGSMDIYSGGVPDRLVGGVDTGYVAGTAYDDKINRPAQNQEEQQNGGDE